MATAMSDMSFWIKFFKEAGVPAGDAANYAVKFSDNRITRSMLMDLTKEYLNDMGITILGDVIAILKHAKSAHSQEVLRDRVLLESSATATPTREMLTPKRSTPASRTIAHHIGSDRSASPTVSMVPVSSNISKSLSARLGNKPSSAPPPDPPKTLITLNTSKPKEVVPVPKKRRVFPEHEGKYKVTMPAGTTARTQKILEMQRKQAEAQRITAEAKKRAGAGKAPLKESVFSRLGSEKPKAKTGSSPTGPTITITGLNNVNMPASATQSSVFNRLGGKTTVKRAATSTTVTFGDDDVEDPVEYQTAEPLEYAGVLKPGASPSKKIKLNVANKLKKTARTTLAMSAAKATEAEPKSAGLFAGSGSANIKTRLGPKVAEVTSTTQSTPAKTTKVSKEGVAGRLGGTQLDKLTITVGTATSSSPAGSGIFSRLGKPK